MNKSERLIRDLLASAGVEVDGTRPWDLRVHNRAFYRRVLRESALGLGESYMDGWWDCEALDEMIRRILGARLEERIQGDWRIYLHALRARLFNLQKPSRAFQIGERHYDLGNDFYQCMLDARMNYTCAYWKNASTLDEAQEAKLELVCRKLNLQPGQRVLELGCGWGSFARYAAEKYGVSVLGVTVSKEQVELGMQWCRGLPVELKLADYREVQGTYDAVVSIGIMEHVGYKNYRTYMQVVDRTLKKDGVAFIHTIGSNESRHTANAWTTKYIFPNAVLPSIRQLSQAMEGILIIEDLHNIGPHYDRTLMAWYENFERHWPQFREHYGDRFYRMWRFYLLSSAGGFRARTNQLWQIIMTRPPTPQPNGRFT
jgi:cyclopropane-fatty-acyl-phospholipid synthase